MKLARFSTGSEVGLAVIRNDALVPLDGSGFTSMGEIITMGETALERITDFIQGKPERHALNDVKLLQPIERVGKYLAIGMNYRRHVAEAEKLGVKPAAYQYWFNKQTSCIAGPFDPIKPGVTQKLDYECELGVVIGSAAKSVTREDALKHVFGYTVANDVSARDWQHHSPTFTMGKSFDTHGPIGPWIVTADEITDPQSLDLLCWVNGELRQSSNSSEMIYSVAEQIEYLSTAFTLEPGDLLATGTPEGVGAAMDPPRFLVPGDVVRCEVSGIGFIENRVFAG
jgi:2-keto-4-pentenoate hydratase/2-oxohepta-3-ene-1,7-dioic acid hydratase in catechol pathway